MKILIATTPIRPVPSTWPPIGSLSVIKALRKAGYDDVDFLHIDGNRPDYNSVIEYISKTRPDVVGISSVVSTAYAYTKKLSIDIKAALPDSLLVVGGNLAASAEILLKKTGIDLCVIGEGEGPFVNVIKTLEKSPGSRKFRDIKGLVYLDEQGNLVNTGYQAALIGDQIWDFDWADLDDNTDISIYFPPAFNEQGQAKEWFRQDPRAYEPARRKKKIGNLKCAKGCVARCTFCHRWDKGIRSIPIDAVMDDLEEIIEKYDVGFIMCNAETFGADKRWLEEFCNRIESYDVLWFAPGVRANSLDEAWIARMKKAGCVRVAYGNETGSESMLQIMEKKVSLEDNYNSMKWAAEAGMEAPVQLVVGMPGETDQTIRETIEFCKYATSIRNDQNPNWLSINYAQALPGTPLYEFARHEGHIGSDLDGEEQYLTAISDRDAHDEYTTINFTENSTLVFRSWRPRITVEVNYHFVRKFGLSRYYQVLLEKYIGGPGLQSGGTNPDDSGYFANPKRLLDTNVQNEQEIPGILSLMREKKFGMAMIYHPVLFYRLRYFLPLMIIVKEALEGGTRPALSMIQEHIVFALQKMWVKRKFMYKYRSLRSIVDKELPVIPGDSPEIAPLRKGR